MKVGFYHASAGETPHVQLAGLMIASVRQWMPGTEIVQFTDDRTRAMAGVDRVERLPAGPIALRCLEAYAQAGDGDWLFLDTDVIVQRDVRWLFDQAEWDIAVATREGTLRQKEIGTKFMARMPYNKGAVFSRSPWFWTWARNYALHELNPKRQQWMGDQVAMNETILRGGFKVHVLPNRYNYPPQSRDEHLIDKAILHYKGPRKRWLLGHSH